MSITKSPGNHAVSVSEFLSMGISPSVRSRGTAVSSRKLDYGQGDVGFVYFEVCGVGMWALPTLRFVVWGCGLCLL